MDKRPTENPPPTFRLEDFYYIIFRHKWKIVFCATVGIVVAAVLFKFKSPFFQSEARLLVRYVVERSGMASTAGDMKSPDAFGETIMSGEVAILTSFDLAQKVAESVGPERILGGSKGGATATPNGGTNEVANGGTNGTANGGTNAATSSKLAAAGAIAGGLMVDPPGRSSIITIRFQHKDPDIPKDVLQQIIAEYFKKHVEIHRAVGIMDDFLREQTDLFRRRVTQTEADLKTLKSKAGVISIDESEKAFATEISRIRQELQSAEGQLAESRAAFNRATNRVSAKVTPQAPEPQVPQIPPKTVDEYRRVVGRLEQFLKRELELGSQLTGENATVRDIRRQIEEAQREKDRMEADEPRFLKSGLPGIVARGADAANGDDPAALAEKITGLEVKITVLNGQLEKARTEAAAVAEAAGQIRDKQRTKELDEAQYKAYSSSLEQARLDEALGAGKLANISVIQTPTPPSKNFKKLYQQMAFALVGGLGGGLAIALLIELVLDQTVRRPVDLLRKLPFPLFLNIPRIASRKMHRALANGSPAPEGPRSGPLDVKTVLPTVAQNGGGALAPYCEALRDRLMNYFHAHNLNHKPKLVAVTGCLGSAGVSTLAAGLAASLSETGDGNVLLVDMNGSQGKAFPFSHGNLSCDLTQVLESDQRTGAQVQENLYVVSAANGDGSFFRVPPKRFGQLMPKLKASDYDYIIFDMPPITQTSVTGKLAGYMDMVLMVVESEKTASNLLSEAGALLKESKVHVATILNKTRRYVPRWVLREYE